MMFSKCFNKQLIDCARIMKFTWFNSKLVIGIYSEENWKILFQIIMNLLTNLLVYFFYLYNIIKWIFYSFIKVIFKKLKLCFKKMCCKAIQK